MNNNINDVSARDIAGNAKLNHEIADELRKYQNNHQLSCQCQTLASRWLRNPYLTWILRSSRSMTRAYVLLSLITLLPTLAHAETCTATPDCKSLGYTEASCPDGGGVKCPWNTSLMYCPKCKNTCTSKNSCEIGDVLYSDKKCYTCPNAYTFPGIAPIGVVFDTRKAVGLIDLNLSTGTTWSNANTLCSNHKPGGTSGWYLPSKDELLAMHGNINAVETGLQSALGGSKLTYNYYWSSSVYSNGNNEYWSVHLLGSGSAGWSDGNMGTNHYVRPVLAF